MVAVTVFLAATLLFIGLFNQTIQTAVIYQRHRATATKASDLLDNMLLSPGIPVNWGQTDVNLTGFGLQDPEFTQYRMSPFSFMRLNSAAGAPVYYYKTGWSYSNITVGSKNFLLVSNTSVIDYSLALRLLGINNTYGFQLTMNPTVTVEVTEDPDNPANPLRLFLDVQGTGFPLANAEITCCLITVSSSGGASYNTIYRTEDTDEQGSATLVFPEVTDADLSYAFIAYAHLGGLVGVGCYERVSLEDEYVLPLVDSISEGRILIAHNFDVQSSDPPIAQLEYNATFVFLAEDFTMREMPLENSAGNVTSGTGSLYKTVNIPTDNPGILIITYRKSANEGGIVMMPWGVSSLAFPIVFGGDPAKQEWVATDMRQVTVGGIAYQAKIAVWNLEGYQVVD